MNDSTISGDVKKSISPAALPAKKSMPASPEKTTHSTTEPTSMQQLNTKAGILQPEKAQTGFYPSAMPQAGMIGYPSAMPQSGMTAAPQTDSYLPATAQMGMYPPRAPQASIFQPPMQTSRQMAPQNGMQPKTSIMTSGRGVRDSVLSDINFTQGFLQTQLGRHVKVEFILGTNMLIDREGDLVRVGTDYIIIQETETDDYLLCDIYSIKFIRFYY